MRKFLSNEFSISGHLFVIMYFIISGSVYLVLSQNYFSVLTVGIINLINLCLTATAVSSFVLCRNERLSDFILLIATTTKFVVIPFFSYKIGTYSVNSILEICLDLMFFFILCRSNVVWLSTIGGIIGFILGIIFLYIAPNDDITQYYELLNSYSYGISTILVNISLIIIVIYHRYITFKVQIESMNKFSTIIAYEVFVPLAVIETSISAFRSSTHSKNEHDSVLQLLKICRLTREKMNFIMNNIRTIQDTHISHNSRSNVSTIVHQCVLETKKNYTNITFKVYNEIIFIGSMNALKCIILNLIYNAFQHGGQDVNVELIMSNNYLIVQDNGHGIKHEEIGDIFKYFVSSAKDHLGIGLSLSRDIARGFGGDIKCISLPGFHTTFIITFPKI